MTLSEHLREWLLGNEAAIAFVLAVHDVVETWDDLYDQDKEVSKDQLNQAFYTAMVTIPRNAFYQAHFAMLSPIIEAAIFEWWASNEFEKQENLEMAWALANAGLNVTVMCARIIGGQQLARRVAVEFRQIVEPLNEFKAERENGRLD